VRLKWPNDVLVGERKLCGTLIEMDGDRLLIGIGCNVMTAPVVGETGVDGGRPSTSLSEHDSYSVATTAVADNTCASEATTTTIASSKTQADIALVNDVSISQSSSTNANTNVNQVDHIKNNNEFGVGSDDNQHLQRIEHYGAICEELAAEITAAVADWIRDVDSRDIAISEFESWMDFSPQILRKEYNTLKDDNSDMKQQQQQSLKGETIIPIRINSDGTLVVKLVSNGEEKVLIADYLW